MVEAHFHLHVANVSRDKGDSSQGAAAYQANQCLIHAGQRICTVAIDHRKALNKGIISGELRRDLETKELFTIDDPKGLALLEAGTAPIARLRLIEKANQKRPVIRQEALPADLTFWQTLLRRFEEAGEALSDRLQLWESQDGFTLRDKDHQQRYHLKVDNGQMVVSRYHGIVLSDQATAQKDKRRYWTIIDGDRRYLVHQYEETAYDKATKKQSIIGRHLDIYGDKAHDYSDKGDVVETWVCDPEHAPASVKALGSQRDARCGAITETERQALWQIAENLETSRNGRPARKIEVALLRELTYEQNKQALNRFVKTHLTDKGLICDIAVHRKIASDGKLNEHAHILFFTREALPGGVFNDKKSSYWNSNARVREWRQGWEQVLNQGLADAGSDARVNKDSYKTRGLAKEPGQHLGPEQWAMEERRIKTEKGKANRRKISRNTSRETAQSILRDQADLLDTVIGATEADSQIIALAAQDQSEPTSDARLAMLAAQTGQRWSAGGDAHHPANQSGTYRSADQQKAPETLRDGAVAFARIMLQRSVRISVRFATRLSQTAARIRNLAHEQNNAWLQRDGRETMFGRVAAHRARQQQERTMDYER